MGKVYVFVCLSVCLSLRVRAPGGEREVVISVVPSWDICKGILALFYRI